MGSWSQLRYELGRDARAIKERDPAAGRWREVLSSYPGLHAVAGYRLAHLCWGRGWRASARFMSYLVRMLTGVDIHPAAKIGPGLFIDHATGVVIGETAEIGHDVTIFHGVTLGGKGLAAGKRHPTIGSGVLLGANSTVLGPVTVGDRARIGAGAVVTHDVPAGATVVGVPGRIVGSVAG